MSLLTKRDLFSAANEKFPNSWGGSTIWELAVLSWAKAGKDSNGRNKAKRSEGDDLGDSAARALMRQMESTNLRGSSTFCTSDSEILGNKPLPHKLVNLLVFILTTPLGILWHHHGRQGLAGRGPRRCAQARVAVSSLAATPSCPWSRIPIRWRSWPQGGAVVSRAQKGSLKAEEGTPADKSPK